MDLKRLLYRTLVTSLRPGLRILDSNAQNSVTVFMFHTLFEQGMDKLVCPSSRSCSDFRAALLDLKKHFIIVSLDEALKQLSAGPRGHYVVLTFDDSLKSSVDLALPILEEQRVPATFFLSTGAIDTQEPYWWHRVEFCAHKSQRRDVRVECNGATFQLSDNPKELVQFKFALKSMDAIARDSIVCGVEKETGVRLITNFDAYPCAKLMSWDDARTLRDAGMTIGSHSVTHNNFNLLRHDQLARELNDSKASIEEKLNIECTHFCYPYGFYSSDNWNAVKQAGYRSGLTCDAGWNKFGTEPLALKRTPLNQRAWKAIYQVTGQHNALQRVKGLVRPAGTGNEY